MATYSIDVDAQLASLAGLKDDLEECFQRIDATSAQMRYALRVAIVQLAQRIAALEDVARHHGGGEAIAVGALSLDESRALDRALKVLDGELVLEGTGGHARLWAHTRLVLAAADDLLLAVARGERVRDLENGSGPRPGVVLPLVRSNR